MVSLTLDGPSIMAAIKAPFLSCDLTLKLFFKKTLEILKLLSTTFGVSLEKTLNID